MRRAHEENRKKALGREKEAAKGCSCKNSRCAKKYCECHSGGRRCSSACKCVGCINLEERFDPKKESGRKLRKMDEESKENMLIVRG